MIEAWGLKHKKHNIAMIYAYPVYTNTNRLFQARNIFWWFSTRFWGLATEIRLRGKWKLGPFP